MTEEIRTPRGRVLRLMTTYEDGDVAEYRGHGADLTRRPVDRVSSVRALRGEHRGTLDECLRWLDARADETVAALLPPGAIVVDAAKLDAIGKAAFVARNDLREKAKAMSPSWDATVAQHYGMRFESIMADVEALRRGTEPVQAIGVLVVSEERVRELARTICESVKILDEEPTPDDVLDRFLSALRAGAQS